MCRIVIDHTMHRLEVATLFHDAVIVRLLFPGNSILFFVATVQLLLLMHPTGWTSLDINDVRVVKRISNPNS